MAPFAVHQRIKWENPPDLDKHAIDVKKLYVKNGNDWKEVQLKDERHKMGEGDTEKKPD